MKRFLNSITKNLPTLITALIMAVAVWVLAVTNTDPVDRRIFNRPVPIEIIGLDPSLIITNDPPDQLSSLILNAPLTTWNSELNVSNAVRAVADLSGLDAGVYEVPVNLQIDAQPVQVQSYSPQTTTIQLEQVFSKSFTINVVQPSTPAVGYEADEPVLSTQTATVSGPSSRVEQVNEVRAVLDISQARENIDRNIPLTALDENGLPVSGVSISPETVRITQKITQKGGYRNISVNPIISGVPAPGYTQTRFSVNPQIVTVFSTDPELINQMNGVIETQPINIEGAEEDIEETVPLNIPQGISVIGESTVFVRITIAPIPGSQRLPNLSIEIVGLLPEYTAEISPETVEVTLSGPLPVLNQLQPSDIRVLLDLSEFATGRYEVEPQVEVDAQGILVDSILPSAIDVQISPLPTATPEQ